MNRRITISSLFHLLVTGVTAALFLSCFVSRARALDLSQEFRTPPKEARPGIWWRFMGDVESREGITADLEAMKRAGVAKAIVSFCSNSLNPAPLGSLHVPILSKEWWEMRAFQDAEAKRLGVDLWFQQCPGYQTSGGPWIKPEEAMQKVVYSQTSVSPGDAKPVKLPVPDIDHKWNYYRDIAVVAFPKKEGGAAVLPEEVVELTSRMDKEGNLDWLPVSGSWNVVRFGHTTTGAENGPVSREGKGLECDKMSISATRTHYRSYFGKLAAAASAGKPGVLFDSWEAGHQNWTSDFREEFRKRRGYDILPWLPVMTGQLIGSEELSRRFDNDWANTIRDLVTDRHFTELVRLAHEDGSRDFILQPYNGPVNFMTAGAVADIPEGEFWFVRKEYGWWTLRMIASVCHINGKPVASAEAFTCSPEDFHMGLFPWSLKRDADLAFTMGINSFNVSITPHNPWPKKAPGMLAGAYGIILGQGQTWNDLATSWVTYLARCSHLLRQGRFAADAAILFTPGQKGYQPPQGYAADLCNEEVILSSMTCDQGMLVLPSGMRYRVLEIPSTVSKPGTPNEFSHSLSPSGIEGRLGKKPFQHTVSLPLLRKLRDLVKEGGVILGPRPVSTPGLSGYPGVNKEFQGLVEELWGSDSGDAPAERTVGKGKVFSEMSLAEVLAKTGQTPDVTIEGADAASVPWIHRHLDGEELYFLSNQTEQELSLNVSFRVTGLVPERWDPDSAGISGVKGCREEKGRTIVPLKLSPRESAFVYFRKDGTAVPAADDLPVRGTLDLNGPWSVAFSAERGGPAQEVSFPKLVSWTESQDPAISHYSGIARYSTTVDVPEAMLQSGGRAVINLGDVKEIARVTVNGKTLPECWKPPFLRDITGALRPGKNEVVIDVANLWVNRMIGDEAEPADLQWGKEGFVTGHGSKGFPLLGYPEWLAKDLPRPSQGRKSFSSWGYFHKEDPLQPSGLLGPVTISFQ